MICSDCGKPVFEREDFIDGLCEQCVDKLLVLVIPSNDGGYQGKPSMKSKYCGSLGHFATERIEK